MGREDAEVIDLDKYRRQQQRALEGKGFKRKLLKKGVVILLGGLVTSAVLLGGYGLYHQFFPSEPTPRTLYHEGSKDNQPYPVEIEFLPLEKEVVEYLPNNGYQEGVRITESGYTIGYFDTNGDHSVDQIIIDDTTAHGLSSLEKKVLVPVSSLDFIYGTALLRRERDARR